jgi:ribosomal protein S18 acetylase RimI-like enzyme
LQSERALLILRRDCGFHRVYHAATDLDTLSAMLRRSGEELAAIGVLTADIIGRDLDVEPIASVYRDEGGFADYNRLLRMTRIAVPEDVTDTESPVEFAEDVDVAAIVSFLERLLDPYTDQIPDENELREASARRNIILARRGKSIGGMLLFETKGLTSHLRYWYVDENARNQGIGARLIRQFFCLSRYSKRVILWVVSKNLDAISKYRHYGFLPDALVDRIMIRRG